MVCVVYIDVLFVLNFIINYLILFASARLSGAVIARWRVAVAGTVGAVYGVLAFCDGFAWLTALWVKLLIACSMVLIAYGGRDMRRNLRLFLVFCGLSFAFGGCAFAMNLITNGAGGNMDMRNGIFYLKVPMGVLLISSVVSYLIFSLVFRRSATGATKQEILEVELEHGGRETVFYALVDSGNTLADPLTNHPVMIVEYESVRDVLPTEVRTLLDSCDVESLPLMLPKLPPNAKFQLIPYKTVGSDLSLMLAFRPDRLIVNHHVRKNMLVALCMRKISDGGAYHALTGLEA